MYINHKKQLKKDYTEKMKTFNHKIKNQEKIININNINKGILKKDNLKSNEKQSQKKVTFIVTPVIKYAGGEKALRPVILVGESAIGAGQKIVFSTGGVFNYASDKIAFEPAMRNAKLELRATGQIKNKVKAFDPIPLALPPSEQISH